MPDLQTKFDKFHEENPHVYRYLEAKAREAVNAGLTRIGADLLISSLRWDHAIRTKGDTFKINQNFAGRYARMIIANHPEWDGLFQFKELRTRYKGPEAA